MAGIYNENSPFYWDRLLTKKNIISRIYATDGSGNALEFEEGLRGFLSEDLTIGVTNEWGTMQSGFVGKFVDSVNSMAQRRAVYSNLTGQAGQLYKQYEQAESAVGKIASGIGDAVSGVAKTFGGSGNQVSKAIEGTQDTIKAAANIARAGGSYNLKAYADNAKRITDSSVNIATSVTVPLVCDIASKEKVDTIKRQLSHVLDICASTLSSPSGLQGLAYQIEAPLGFRYDPTYLLSSNTKKSRNGTVKVIHGDDGVVLNNLLVDNLEITISKERVYGQGFPLYIMCKIDFTPSAMFTKEHIKSMFNIQ